MQDRHAIGESYSFSELIGRKIVFVFGNLELGGAERQGYLVARHLKDHTGAKPMIVGLDDKPGQLAKLCDEAGIPWRGLMLGRMRNRREWLIGLYRFIKHVRQEQPSILIPYTKRPNIICGITWRFTGAEGCIWNQADEGFGMGRAFMNRLAVSLTPSFVSNSSAGRSFLQGSFKVPDAKVTVIHNGMALAPPVATREEWRKLLGITEDSFVATMVANISTFKDHKTLIKAWHIVLTSCSLQPAPILLLAGRFDGPEQDLMKLVSQMGIEKQVRFLGEVSDVAGLLRTSDLFVYSSVSEGLPNAVIEAMATGLPVVGTDIPGIREAVGPAGIQFLVPVGDANLLGRKIQLFINDPQLGGESGQILKGRSKEEFSLSTMLDETVKLIQQRLY